MRSTDPVVAQGAMEVPDMTNETPSLAVDPAVTAEAQPVVRPRPSPGDAFVLFCLVAAPFLVLFMLALTTGR
jgi:hypothetical protein